MDLKIPFNNCTTKAEAYLAVKSVLTPTLMAKFKVNPEFTYYENESIAAKGKGFDFELKFQDDAVEVHLNLGLFLKAFKTQVLAGIEKQVTRII